MLVREDNHGYVIHACVPDDAATIAQHRAAMFTEMGVVPSDDFAHALMEASRVALGEALRDGSYVGWFATVPKDRVIAGAGLHIKPTLPRMTDDRTRIATTHVPLVVNVYTERAYRQRGIAKVLMQTAMGWAVAQGFDCLVLHASDAGRPLYTSLGFMVTNEMRWFPKSPRS